MRKMEKYKITTVIMKAINDRRDKKRCIRKRKRRENEEIRNKERLIE